MEIVLFEGFLLPAGAVEILAEITFLIEQTDGDEGKAEIAGSFQVITGEHAEATGKNGEAFSDAEFQGEISYEEILVFDVFALVPRALRVEVGIQAFGDALQVSEERIIAGGCLEAWIARRCPARGQDCGQRFPRGRDRSGGRDRWRHDPNSSGDCRRFAARASENRGVKDELYMWR